MSQLPPCSGRPGIVRAPWSPTFSFVFGSAEPAWTLRGWGLGVGLVGKEKGGRGGKRQGDVSVELVGGDELGFALVPGVEDFLGGSTAEDAGVDEAGELDVGDVAGGAVDAFKVPDGFGCGGVELVKEATLSFCCQHEMGREREERATYTIGLVKDAREAPWLVLKGLDVHDLYEKGITWLGIFNGERAGQVVNTGEVDILDVVRGVVVLDLAAGPVQAFNLDRLAIFDGGCWRDVWVPPVL